MTDWQGRKVLVTGADGFIGSHLTERLVEAGVPTTLIDEPGLTHGYLNYDGLCDEAARARDRVAAALEG